MRWAAAKFERIKKFQQKYGWEQRKNQDEEIKGQALAFNAAESSSSSTDAAPAPIPHLPNATAWVVTKARSKGLGCLHVVGRCFRVPGVHYKELTEVTEAVQARAYGKACKQCFPLGFPNITDGHVETISSKKEMGMPEVAVEEEISSSHS